MKVISSGLLCLSLLMTTLLAATAQAAEKHVHGEAVLLIAIDDKQVLLELETPADNILGFEHKPSTAAQKKVLHDSLARLADYTAVLQLDQGDCKQVSSDIESPFESADAHGHKNHDHADDHHEDEHRHHEDEHDHHHEDEHHDHDEATHTDFHLKYTLHCADTSAITTAKVSAFEAFARFETIQVNWVTPAQQGSRKTTKAQAAITF
ncbi:MAG: DUF2796 domain-containing protein [Cellvibrionaceae bacterium]|nr:DUF2796 domain-containing protein [Cellvibrionaceae bacterium]